MIEYIWKVRLKGILRLPLRWSPRVQAVMDKHTIHKDPADLKKAGKEGQRTYYTKRYGHQNS